MERGEKEREIGGSPPRFRLILTHHKVTAEVILSSLVALSHGVHPMDELSEDAGLVHAQPSPCPRAVSLEIKSQSSRGENKIK